MVGVADGATLQCLRSLDLWMRKVIAIAGSVSGCIAQKSGKRRIRNVRIVRMRVGIAEVPRDSKRDIAALVVERARALYAVM